jgi:hypothetical protein
MKPQGRRAVYKVKGFETTYLTSEMDILLYQKLKHIIGLES